MAEELDAVGVLSELDARRLNCWLRHIPNTGTTAKRWSVKVTPTPFIAKTTATKERARNSHDKGSPGGNYEGCLETTSRHAGRIWHDARQPLKSQH
jgi:hypothetical protein